MDYQISIEGTAIAFACSESETVLNAVERSGYGIPYSCRKGVCSTCEGGLADGVGLSSVQGRIEGPAEHVLLCCLRPGSDLRIAPRRIEKREPAARKMLDTTVYRITRPTTDVSVLQLRLPAGVRAKFRAGQYLQVEMEGGERRNYSMANAPHENDGVLLHVRHVPGGRFSEGVLKGLEKGHKLRVELPFGEFSLQEDSSKPVILLATGTGFAPIKSIIEDAIKRKTGRRFVLYWGARRHGDMYMAELAAKWAKQGRVTFVPVLSEPDNDWTGRRGFVHEVVLQDHASLEDYQVYACGNPAMTNAARVAFTHAGLPEDDFFSDAFVHTGSAA